MWRFEADFSGSAEYVVAALLVIAMAVAILS
jgi:hypothetical protein